MEPTTPWPVCTNCQRIPLSLFSAPAEDLEPPRHPLWPSFTALVESALRGCHPCTLFYEAVREPFKSRLETAQLYLESAKTDDGKRTIALTADLVSLSDESSQEHVQLQGNSRQTSGFLFTPIASVKSVADYSDVPAIARHYKGAV